MSAILEQLKAERNEIAKAIRVVLDDGTAPDNLVEHVRFLMLEEYDPIVKRNDELKGGIAALRERVKVLEDALLISGNNLTDVKSFLEAEIKVCNGVGVEYELGLVESIDAFQDLHGELVKELGEKYAALRGEA